MPDTGQRLVRLEEDFYFLEAKIASLDEQLTAQQRQLDLMQKNIMALTSAFQTLRNQLEFAHKNGAQIEEIPPHHEPRLW